MTDAEPDGDDDATDRIAAAAADLRREIAEHTDRAVTIVAVTKTFGPEMVDAVRRAGLEDIGENYRAGVAGQGRRGDRRTLALHRGPPAEQGPSYRPVRASVAQPRPAGAAGRGRSAEPRRGGADPGERHRSIRPGGLRSGCGGRIGRRRGRARPGRAGVHGHRRARPTRGGPTRFPSASHPCRRARSGALLDGNEQRSPGGRGGRCHHRPRRNTTPGTSCAASGTTMTDQEEPWPR